MHKCLPQGIVIQHKLNIASPGSNAPVAVGKSTAACKSRLFTLDTVLLPADIQLPDQVRHAILQCMRHTSDPRITGVYLAVHDLATV
jgi:hypothetical protein